MQESKILYAIDRRHLIIKMMGEIRHPLSPGLNLVLENVFAQGEVDRFIIDLREARFLDSTNLGLLAKMARHNWERKKEMPVIVSDNTEVNAVLHSMGFEEAFHLMDEWDELPLPLKEVPNTDLDYDRKTRLLLEAHKKLMEVSEKSRALFHDVVELMEKDLPPQS